MRVIYGKWFFRSAELLPPHLQRKLDDLIYFLESDPFHHLLHTKPLAGELKSLFSFRITRDWRVIFYFIDDHAIQLLKVAHRKDIYR